MPTLILLEDNIEYLRFPPIDYDKGTLGRVVAYKEKELIRYFDLDKRFLATYSASTPDKEIKKKRGYV